MRQRALVAAAAAEASSSSVFSPSANMLRAGVQQEGEDGRALRGGGGHGIEFPAAPPSPLPPVAPRAQLAATALAHAESAALCAHGSGDGGDGVGDVAVSEYITASLPLVSPPSVSTSMADGIAQLNAQFATQCAAQAHAERLQSPSDNQWSGVLSPAASWQKTRTTFVDTDSGDSAEEGGGQGAESSRERHTRGGGGEEGGVENKGLGEEGEIATETERGDAASGVAKRKKKKKK